MSSAPAAAAQGPGVVKGTDAEAGSAVRGLGWAGRIRSVRLSQSRRAIPDTLTFLLHAFRLLPLTSSAQVHTLCIWAADTASAAFFMPV